jgi:hypothetical protein
VLSPDDEPVWRHALQLHWLRLNRSDSTVAQHAAAALTEEETYGVTSAAAAAARDLAVPQCQRLSLAAAASATAVIGFIQAAWLVGLLLAVCQLLGIGLGVYVRVVLVHRLRSCNKRNG